MLKDSENKTQLSKFVDEYVIDNNAIRAARAVGVRPSTAEDHAKRWLKRSDVQQSIAVRIDEIKKQAAVSPEWVLTELKYMYQISKADGDMPNSMRALEMLAKHVGLFATPDKNGGNITVVVQNYADVKID